MNKDNINNIKDGLDNLVELLNEITDAPAQAPVIEKRSLSGDTIIGGTIKNFSSTGIKDSSTRLVVLVNNDGLLTDFIDVDTLVGTVNVEEDLVVGGSITASKLHVNELTADIRNERSTPLEFTAEGARGNDGQGLVWSGNGKSKKLIYLSNPDRLWSSSSIDLYKDNSYSIDKIDVLNLTTLGSSVTTSSLTSVGTLQNLNVSGDVNLNDLLFWNSTSGRLSIGTESPAALFSIATQDGQFIVDPTANGVKIGSWSSDDVVLVSDDTERMRITTSGAVEFGIKGAASAKVNVHGQLGVGINNIDADISIATSGPIQIQNKKFEIGDSIPISGVYNKGDIIWNTNPTPAGYVGWICTREGTPGLWKPFGAIAS